MPRQIVMDRTGDTCFDYKLSDAEAIAKAEQRFMELTGSGFVAAEKTGQGTSKIVDSFNKDAEETLFMPRLKGG